MADDVVVTVRNNGPCHIKEAFGSSLRTGAS